MHGAVSCMLRCGLPAAGLDFATFKNHSRSGLAVSRIEHLMANKKRASHVAFTQCAEFLLSCCPSLRQSKHMVIIGSPVGEEDLSISLLDSEACLEQCHRTAALFTEAT